MPSSCGAVNDSPAMRAPSTTPVTGLSRPMSPTEPAGSRCSALNQATQASAVAMRVM